MTVSVLSKICESEKIMTVVTVLWKICKDDKRRVIIAFSTAGMRMLPLEVWIHSSPLDASCVCLLLLKQLCVRV